MVLGLLAVVAALAAAGGAALLGSWIAGRLHDRYSGEARTRRALERHRRALQRRVAKIERWIRKAVPEVEVEVVRSSDRPRDVWDHISFSPSGRENEWIGSTVLYGGSTIAEEAYRILQGEEPDMPVEELVRVSRADSLVLQVLATRPELNDVAQAAAAVHLTRYGFTSHTLVEGRYMEAAGAYLTTLEQWPMRNTAYGTTGEILQNVEHVLVLLDPVLRETYVGIAQGWNGNVDTAIEAARCVLAP